MAHHKRGKPKAARAGCLLCKFWKVWGNKADRRPAHERARRDAMKREAAAF